MLKHVVELYDSFVVREEVVKAKAIHDSSSSSAVTAPAPSAGSFLDLLHLYYPSFSRTTLESMVRDAREGIDAVDRRRFLIMAKGHYAARLKMAFLNCDKDKSGGLSVDEFIAAVQSTGAKPPTTSKNNSTPTPKAPLSPNAAARTLRVLFAQADENRDGILQFDEFLELCAHQPWLVSAFDKIVEHGVRRKLRSEEARLSTIFRTPISPLSRMVMSPGGRGRFRPCMCDLRPVDEVGSLLEEADSKKKHEA